MSSTQRQAMCREDGWSVLHTWSLQDQQNGWDERVSSAAGSEERSERQRDGECRPQSWSIHGTHNWNHGQDQVLPVVKLHPLLAHKPALSLLLDSCDVSSSSHCHVSLRTNVLLRKSPHSYKPRAHLLFHDGGGRGAQGLVSQGSCSVSQGRLLLQRAKFNKHAISREVISDASVPVRAIT